MSIFCEIEYCETIDLHERDRKKTNADNNPLANIIIFINWTILEITLNEENYVEHEMSLHCNKNHKIHNRPPFSFQLTIFELKFDRI
jgi:hypothetical protein